MQTDAFSQENVHYLTGLQSSLQYYSLEMKMEGYNPFSAINKLKSVFHIPDL